MTVRPWTNALVYLAPFIYAILVFSRVFGNTFWLDDYGWVSTAAEASRSPSRLFDTQAGFFRPVINVVFLANFWLFRIDEAGYYAFNLIVHLINVALVMLLGYSISGNRRFVAAAAGLLFAGAIGNYGEAVIWISGRTELVATAFYLGTLLAFWMYLRTSSPGWYGAAAICFTLALFSKESAVTLLCALVLLDWLALETPLSTVLSVCRAVRYIPFLCILIPYLVIQYFVVTENVIIEEQDYALGFHAAPNLIEYLTLMILPVGPDSTIVSLSSSQEAVVRIAQIILGLVVISFWTFMLIRLRIPALRFAVAWMVLSIVPYAFFTTKTTVRYLYLPSVALVLAIALLINAAVQKYGLLWTSRQWIRVSALAAVVGVFALQWLVVNFVIQRWHTWQAAQDPIHLQQIENLTRSLGY